MKTAAVSPSTLAITPAAVPAITVHPIAMAVPIATARVPLVDDEPARGDGDDPRATAPVRPAMAIRPAMIAVAATLGGIGGRGCGDRGNRRQGDCGNRFHDA